MFLRNCWYVAGWSHHFQEGRPVARTMLGEPCSASCTPCPLLLPMQQGDDGFDFFSVAVVLALVSCGNLATVIIMFLNTTPHAVPEVFAAALTTILGFWFGKLTR